MLIEVSLQTDAFHYEGKHQQGIGRGGGTVLGFDILLEPTSTPRRPGDPVIERRNDPPLWKATVDVHNDSQERPVPTSSEGYKAQAFGRNPVETLAKLADNLRRVAEALDKALDEGVVVPIVLRRKPEEAESELETPQEEKPSDEALQEALS